jgi:hypothetical protein
MAESKYGKYIIRDLRPLPEFKQKNEGRYAQWAKRVLWLDDKVIEGAFHVNFSWYLKPTDTEEEVPHAHDFNEVLGFLGSDMENPYDLGGEIEFWLEGEKHVLKNSCLIYIPRGLKHCPMIVKRVDRPIIHITIGTGGQYTKDAAPSA